MSALQPDLADLEMRFADNPADRQVLRDLAECYFSKGVFNTRAAGVYEKARLVMPAEMRFSRSLNLSCFLKHLRRFTIESSDPELIDVDGIRDAIALIKEYLKELKNSPDLFVALGDLYLVKGDILLAIGAYENAMKCGFRDVSAILRSYQFASQLNTFQPSERSYFARLYQQEGLHDEAIALYRSVITEGFHDRQVIEDLKSLLEASTGVETNQNALNNIYMNVTELCLLAGDTEAALASFARVCFPINQNYGLVKRVAEVLIKRQDYRLAFEYLSKIPVDEENKSLINRITVELEKIGEIDTAVYLLQFINDNDLVIKEAQALREKEMEIHTELAVADLNFSNGRHDLAMGSYTKVLKLGYKDDAAVLSRIIELLPLLKSNHVDDLHVIGQYYLSRQDYYRASQFYNLILERRQNDAAAQGRLREIYDAILERNPNLPELRLRSGDLYASAGEPDKSIAEYKHAAQFPETNIEATRRLAVSYIKTQNHTAALDAYQEMPVAEIDLENLYQLHLILYEEGKIADALSLLRMISDIDETYRDVRDRIDLLRYRFEQEEETVAPDPRMKELIGDVAVGRYRYLEKIGSGGMGVVHKVFDQKLAKAVAMKILREGLANSNKAIERFFREARIAATLNHTNIVNIFDYNINNVTHQSYISMEFVDGNSLRELLELRLAQSGDVAMREVVLGLSYLSQLCDALHVTHSKGIIHRDIKPDNILVSSQGVIKVTDFGIVHIEEATFTPTGALIGTPRYMAPEQVQGLRLDGRADLYAAGIILYEWLVGAPPFISGDVAYQQVNIQPTPPKELCDVVDTQVNDLIMKCLEKTPADRFQSARDLKAAADRVLKRLAPDGVPGMPPSSETVDTDFDSLH